MRIENRLSSIRSNSRCLAPACAVSVLALACVFAGCGTEPTRPGARVVEEAVSEHRREFPEPGQAWKPGVDRLYRMGDTWVARRETGPAPLALSPNAQRVLLASGEGIDPLRHPAPLAQELADELAAVKRLAVENRTAMEQMREATLSLEKTARDLLRRNEALAELAARARVASNAPTPTPAPARDELP